MPLCFISSQCFSGSYLVFLFVFLEIRKFPSADRSEKFWEIRHVKIHEITGENETGELKFWSQWNCTCILKGGGERSRLHNSKLIHIRKNCKWAKSRILCHISRHSHIGPFSGQSQFQLQPVPYPMSCFQAQSIWPPILWSVTVPTSTSPLSHVMFPGTDTLAHYLACHSFKNGLMCLYMENWHRIRDWLKLELWLTIRRMGHSDCAWKHDIR